MGNFKYTEVLIHFGCRAFLYFFEFLDFGIRDRQSLRKNRVKVSEFFYGKRLIRGKFVRVVAEILIEDHRVKIL